MFLGVGSSFALLFTELDDVLGCVEPMEQSSPRIVRHTFETADTSGDEMEDSEPRRRVLSKRTYKKEKVWGGCDLGRFFVTVPTDASGKTSQFYCRICRKDVSVMTHGVRKILRHYQGTKLFQRNQRLRLETPGWRVLYFEGNVMREEEVERQRELILRTPQVAWDREYLFSEDLIVESSDSVDVSLPVLAKVSALVEALRLGGSYEPVHQLWPQFTLTAGQVNVDVMWYRDEVLISGFFCQIARTHPSCLLYICFQSIILTGTYPQILSKTFTWAKAHGYCGIEFVERGEHIWMFI